jgi:hypothetical protein
MVRLKGAYACHDHDHLCLAIGGPGGKQMEAP